jgi:toxin-antitoxin system PIN domain toxin
VKLLDVNLLVYATNAAAPGHARARTWFEETMSGAETVALPWHTLVGFVRLTTRRVIMDPPLEIDQALNYVEDWLQQPCATTVHPTYRHSAVLRDLLRAVGTAGNRVPDAHLAALAIEHGATLYSADEDFGRFPGLTWFDPLRS